jgi:hypothetical protein
MVTAAASAQAPASSSVRRDIDVFLMAHFSLNFELLASICHPSDSGVSIAALPSSPLPAGIGIEHQFNVVAQMIDAGRSDVRSACGFREDEGTLEHRLGVDRQAVRRPFF